MRLITDKGELSLPEDFSFEIEQNSAFFSEDGAATVAATIPATSEDQEKLGFPARVARANKFDNFFPCLLTHGIFQKKGVLVVDSASRNGMVCSIALEDSEFYSQYKDRDIKELFSSKILTDYSTPEEWYNWLLRVYKGEVVCDLQVVPVATSCGVAGQYMIMNKPVPDAANAGIWELEHGARIITEGSDEKVSVPEGYGITPFLKLKDFIKELFEQCGYQVRNNCFATNNILESLILLNNCADTICSGKINYSDLVPSMKVSEFLEWLKNKFFAQIEVYPSEKVVDVILLKDILTAPYDLNLTDKIIGLENYAFSKPTRLVITPDTSLDNAAPAAETLPDLIDKYKYVYEIKENEFITPRNSSGNHSTGLELRLSTGEFVEQKTTLGGVKAVRLGSNLFKYDRRNAEDSEDYTMNDVSPVMVWQDGYLMPYIGERIHRNTSYEDSEKDESQPIIIADYAGTAVPVNYGTTGGHYNYATTQKYDNAGELRAGKISLIPEDMFFEFFKDYNDIILNNSVKIDVRLDLKPEEITKYKMYSRKMLDGQYLLPISISYEVGYKLICRRASFMVLKSYRDSVEDSPISFISPKYKWVLNDSEIIAKKNELASSNLPGNPAGKSIQYKWAEDDEWKDGNQDLTLPTPTAAGQTSSRINRRVEYFVAETGQAESSWHSIGVFSLDEWYYSVEI